MKLKTFLGDGIYLRLMIKQFVNLRTYSNHEEYLTWYQENCRIYVDEYEKEENSVEYDETNSFILSRFRRKT